MVSHARLAAEKCDYTGKDPTGSDAPKSAGKVKAIGKVARSKTWTGQQTQLCYRLVSLTPMLWC